MSEAMTVETIVEAYWQLKGFWTKLRFPFQTDGGGWADIDVLAYHPEERTLVIAESKVRGPKTEVYAYTEYTRQKDGNIFEYDGDNYLAFLKYIKPICSKNTVFSNFRKMVDKVIIQLVSNYYVDGKVSREVTRDIKTHIKESIPRGIETEIRVDTTLSIISEIIKVEKSIRQGRRYGHPVIDIARELNRYLHPDIRCAGKEKKMTEAVKSKLRETFLDSLK
jgi:hypothetical protein